MHDNIVLVVVFCEDYSGHLGKMALNSGSRQEVGSFLASVKL